MSQPGYARTTETLCRDNMALRRVGTEKAMRDRQTRRGAHDIGILSRQTSYSG